PTTAASLTRPYAGLVGVPPARLRRGVENAHTTGRIRGWDSTRVDEGVTGAGIRKVLHAVVAYALSEPESGLLLLGTPLVACEPRRLQLLARAEGLLDRRGVRVHRRAVRHRFDGQRARRVRVRERADTVGAHALGELHGPRVRGACLGAAAAARA